MGYYKNNDGDLLKVAGSSLYADIPIGVVIGYGGEDVPIGWHICDGTALSRTDYAELFAKIGTNYGVGDGSTTFNIPDMRGEYWRGAGTNSHSGQGDGGLVGEHQDATVHCAMETSGNRIYYPNGYALENKSGVYAPSNADSYAGLESWYYSAVGTNNGSGNGATFTSRPTSTSGNFIIKCKPVAFPSDVLTQIGDALSYSTAEKLTGGRWIDGKPIYVKTFIFGQCAVGSQSMQSVAGLNISEAINISGTWQRDDASENCYPFMGCDDYVAGCTAGYAKTDQAMYIFPRNGYPVKRAYVTIQYTKTTD